MRRVHLGSIDPKEIADYLRDQIEQMTTEEATLTNRHETKIDMPAVEAWADSKVAKVWNSYLAARTCHIGRTGFDGEIINRFDQCKPHERLVSSEREVPRRVCSRRQCLSFNPSPKLAC